MINIGKFEIRQEPEIYRSALKAFYEKLAEPGVFKQIVKIYAFFREKNGIYRVPPESFKPDNLEEAERLIKNWKGGLPNHLFQMDDINPEIYKTLAKICPNLTDQEIAVFQIEIYRKKIDILLRLVEELWRKNFTNTL